MHVRGAGRLPVKQHVLQIYHQRSGYHPIPSFFSILPQL